MLHYGIVTAFSGKPLLNTHVGPRNHQSIVTWTSPEWFTLDYGIITVLSYKLLLHQSCCTIESSKQSHMNSSWIANVRIRNHHNIVTWTPPEWMAHVRLRNPHIIISWTPPDCLTLAYGNITAYSGQLLMKDICWTAESSQHSHLNSPDLLKLNNRIITAFLCKLILHGQCCTMESWRHFLVYPSWKAHFELRKNHSILTWTPTEELMLDYWIIRTDSRKLILKDSCWTKESSQHSYLSSSGMCHVALWITTALLHELPQHELLMLDYGIITPLSRELLYELLILDYECSHHCLVNTPCMVHVALWNHQSILTWTIHEKPMLKYGIIITLSG
jgi:hypothetical protein